MNNKVLINKALAYFESDFKCSQSVFTPFALEEGLPKETALKISKFLGSGFLYRGEMCGAVSGALMSYSLKYASGSTPNEVSDEIFYKLCAEHIEKFKSKFGSVSCKELIGYNMGVPEEYQLAKESGVFDKLCPLLVTYSAQLLAESISYIEEKKKKYPDLFE